MRRALIALAVVALAVVLFVGLRSAPKQNTDIENAAPSTAEVQKAFAGSPAPLAKLHDQKDSIIGGSQKALEPHDPRPARLPGGREPVGVLVHARAARSSRSSRPRPSTTAPGRLPRRADPGQAPSASASCASAR